MVGIMVGIVVLHSRLKMGVASIYSLTRRKLIKREIKIVILPLIGLA